MKLSERVEALEERVKQLESRPVHAFIPYIQAQPVYPQPWVTPSIEPWITYCGAACPTYGQQPTTLTTTQ